MLKARVPIAVPNFAYESFWIYSNVEKIMSSRIPSR